MFSCRVRRSFGIRVPLLELVGPSVEFFSQPIFFLQAQIWSGFFSPSGFWLESSQAGRIRYRPFLCDIKSIKTRLPNRRPRFPLGAFGRFAYPCCAPPASPAAVGEAQRSAMRTPHHFPKVT